MSKLKKIILTGILLALFIVLNRFISIKTPLLIISFSYIPIMMAAIWLGPKYSILVAALGDFLASILFPFGTYFPGFTLSAGISGLIYGIFLYRKPEENISNKKFILKLIISNLIVLSIIEIFVVSFWLKIMYGKAYMIVVSSRVLAQVIMLPIRIVTIYALEKLTRPVVNKYLYKGDIE